MLNMTVIIERIRQEGNRTMSEIFNDLIEDNEVKKDKMISNYERYKASNAPNGVPVFSRKFDDPNKINRKVNNAFDADIVDTKLGYMVGNPIIYDLDKDQYTTGETLNETSYNADIAIIDEFNLRNIMEDLDGETLKKAAICGYGARLLYINRDGKESVMDVKPWECIFVNDGSLNEAQYAMRYYEMRVGKETRIYVEWYDEKTVYYYLSDDVQNRSKGQRLSFEPYVKDGKTSQPHMFDGVPLIQFENNEEHQGDCDKIYQSIDGYDATISDVGSELEQFRLAYMAFYGMYPDSKTIEDAKRTGAFGMPDPEARIEFITKELNDTVIENHLNRLEDNIYRFGKSVNFSDESFAGTITGIAMKFKMFGLESKCVISERKFTAALRTQYKLLSSVWAKKGTKIDYTHVTFTWTRNFPLNLLDEADTTGKLKGNVSEKTRLGLLSFIDDPQKEMEQMEKENEMNPPDLDLPQVDDEGNPIPKKAPFQAGGNE